METSGAKDKPKKQKTNATKIMKQLKGAAQDMTSALEKLHTARQELKQAELGNFLIYKGVEGLLNKKSAIERRLADMLAIQEAKHWIDMTEGSKEFRESVESEGDMSSVFNKEQVGRAVFIGKSEIKPEPKTTDLKETNEADSDGYYHV